MKILFVTPRLPLPADTGAKIRTYNLLKNTAKDNQASLLSFYQQEDDKAVNDLKSLGIRLHLVKAKDKIKVSKILGHLPVSIEKYSSEIMEEKLKELLTNEKFNLIHFDHLHMGQYKEYVNGLPCILDEHNVESVILERCASIEKGLIKKLLFRSQSKKMASFESNLISKFSKCLAVSEDDKKNLLKMSENKAEVEVIPNGVDTEYFNLSTIADELKEEDSLVFTGSMDWLPNTDAVIYFAKEILPLIWNKNNQVKFYIVGKNPTKEVLSLGDMDNRIIITGTVDDVRPYIAKSKVFVVPIRVGGGTRLKILEAMAMSKAIVSTTIAAEGIKYTNGHNIIIQDYPLHIANSILALLEDEQKRNNLGQAGRDLACNCYDWKIISQKLNNIYKTLVS